VTAPRPIRFGVVVPALESSGELNEIISRAEDLGYAALLFVDHLTSRPAPLVAAATALARSARLRVGTQVIAAPLHHPVMLAKEVTTLDLLSDGRFDFGIGAGWPRDSDFGRSDFDQTGIDPGDARARADRLIETVLVFQRFQASTQRWDHHGARWQLRNIAPFPFSGPRRRTPLIIGGAGQRLLGFAARHADVVNIAPRPPVAGRTAAGGQAFGTTIAEQVAMIRTAAGERYHQLELAVMSTGDAAELTGDGGHSQRRLTRLAALLNTTVQGAAAMPSTLIGSRGQLLDRVLEQRERYDITYRTVPAAAMAQFAPLVADLAGR
jgi:probable F420-dependent oxidoreductase